MVRAVALLAFSLTVASSLGAPGAAVKSSAPQDLWLAREATGNFACNVDELVVSTESPGETDSPLVTPDHIRAAFANVASLEWAHVPQSSFASTDGRNDEKVLGTPGGDMGEFILSLQAFAKASGTPVTANEATSMLEKYLKVMTREKFFYETDERAYTRLAVASGCRNLHITEMGGMKHKREVVVQEMIKPEHVGDPIIRFMIANATELGLDTAVTHAALTAFHNVLWSTPSRLAQKLCYLEVKGPHKEAAVVNVRLPQFCIDQGLAPMVSQQFACSSPVFVNHPDAAKLLRRDMVSVITDGTDTDPSEVLASLNQLAVDTFDKFLADKTELPVYDVVFRNSSPLLGEPDAAAEEA